MRLEGDDYMTIEQCYLLSRVFMALAILLAVIMVIYGYNNKIILKIQKFYGIEKKREVRKMINSHYASNVKYKGNDNLVTPAGMDNSPAKEQEESTDKTMKLDVGDEICDGETMVLSEIDNAKFVKKKDIMLSQSTEY